MLQVPADTYIVKMCSVTFEVEGMNKNVFVCFTFIFFNVTPNWEQYCDDLSSSLFCWPNNPPGVPAVPGLKPRTAFSCHSLPTPWPLEKIASLHGCFRSRRRSPHTTTVLLERFIKQTNLDGSLVAKAPFNLRLASLRRNMFLFIEAEHSSMYGTLQFPVDF